MEKDLLKYGKPELIVFNKTIISIGTCDPSGPTASNNCYEGGANDTTGDCSPGGINTGSDGACLPGSTNSGSDRCENGSTNTNGGDCIAGTSVS